MVPVLEIRVSTPEGFADNGAKAAASAQLVQSISSALNGAVAGRGNVMHQGALCAQRAMVSAGAEVSWVLCARTRAKVMPITVIRVTYRRD